MNPLQRRLVLPAAAILCVMVATPALAQQFSIGPKGGLTLGDISSDQGGESSYKPGFALGGFIGFGLTDIVTVQPEVMFTQKGTKFTDEAFNEVITTRLDYVEIPLLIVFDIPVSGSVQPFLYAGPTFAFNTLAEVTIESGGSKETVNVKDSAKTTDLGIAFGGGVRVSDFGIEARYTAGLSNIAEADVGEKLKTRTFTILAFYSFSR